MVAISKLICALNLTTHPPQHRIYILNLSWWRHQMETFYAVLTLCEGNPPVRGRFTSQRPVTQSFEVFLDLRLNKWLSKQSNRRWSETPSCSLWRHRNVWYIAISYLQTEMLTFEIPRSYNAYPYIETKYFIIRFFMLQIFQLDNNPLEFVRKGK